MAYQQSIFYVVLKSVKYILETIFICRWASKRNSETQRLVQKVILKLEKINMVFVKPVMVKHPSRKFLRHIRDASVIDLRQILVTVSYYHSP